MKDKAHLDQKSGPLGYKPYEGVQRPEGVCDLKESKDQRSLRPEGVCDLKESRGQKEFADLRTLQSEISS
ncbi:UNVERIFIED_CONTAM: hypothetical protein Slati_4275200 [Sesamum latifolium]|uniref:Uncharacterized protein n=1 Tax=Sesamum latifolium TaxID=2727402 RepID=A0AAW2TE70_9LAMI